MSCRDTSLALFFTKVSAFVDSSIMADGHFKFGGILSRVPKLRGFNVGSAFFTEIFSPSP